MVFYYFCTLIIYLMIKSLLFVWVLAVIAFFVLWALIALVVRRISERKNNAQKPTQEESIEKSSSADQPS